MVNRGPRKRDNLTRDARYEEELRHNPPILIWELIPNSGGLRVAVYVKDPAELPGRRPGRQPRPPCECNLYGSPKRRIGPHHDETCARRTP